MDWSKGFSASYHMTIVDPVTWRDIERVEITGGSISRSDDKLRESADVDCVDYDIQQERWIRLWLDARQADDSVHVPLFTGLACSPSVSINGRRREYPLECYSVLKPADDVLLERGWFAGAGFSGADVIIDLLSVCPTPIETEGYPPTLSQAIIAEDGETRLSMADKVLEAMGDWRLRISGDGTITICEKSTAVVATFGMEHDVVEPSVDIKHDWYSCPNVFRAICDDQYAVAKDEVSDTYLSIENRGREVWQEDDVDLNDGETIAECAERLLREAQSSSVEVSYDRRFDPDVFVGDMIRLHYPGSGLQGDYTVVKQTIELGYGAKVSEEVETISDLRIVKEYEQPPVTEPMRLVTSGGDVIVTSGGDTLIAV